MCRSTLGLALLALFLSGADNDDPEQKAVALVKRLGGRIGRDEKKAGKPIVFVRLSSSPVADADLKELAALKRLADLILSRTKISDWGLKDLAGFDQLRRLDLPDTQITDRV
jgi:hypothetical protein